MSHYDLILARVANLPPVLDIPTFASVNGERVGTIYQQIRRNIFPIAVHQRSDGKLFILLVDALKFWENGIQQEQPLRTPRTGRNPFGKSGKQGRPTKARSVANANARAAAVVENGQGGQK
jgi:hypothetical protein